MKEKDHPFWRARSSLYRSLFTRCFARGLDGVEIEAELKAFRELMQDDIGATPSH